MLSGMWKPARVLALLPVVLLSACPGRSGPEALAVRHLASEVDPAAQVLRLFWTPPERTYELRRYEWRLAAGDSAVPCPGATGQVYCWRGVHRPAVLEFPLTPRVNGADRRLRFELRAVYHRYQRISGELVRAWVGPASSLDVVLPECCSLSVVPGS